MVLERLELKGDLLTCVEKSGTGRCIRYLQTCDSDDCITESPGHPVVPGREKKKRKKKTTAKKTATKRRATKDTIRTGYKEPWQLTRVQWERAKDAQKQGTAFTETPSAANMAESAHKMKEFVRLNYDSGIFDANRGEVRTDHKLVIAKAFSEGKKIPKYVLDEYPDMAAFAESPGYKKDRKVLADMQEVTAGEKRKVAAGKKLLQIDMVYDTDLESAISRVLELKPTANYYLRTKSQRRTYVDSATPFKGQPYVLIDKNWKVTRFDAAHKEIEGEALRQNDRIYAHDILKTAEIVNALPGDQRRGATYYLTRLSDERTKVESKTPGGTGPYIRVDYRGISHFDADRKQVRKKSPSERGETFDVPMLQPPGAEKWEVLNPPVMKGSQSVPLKKGERLYIISDRSTRKDPGTDFAVVAGEPIIKIEELKQLDLFLHKSTVNKGWWKISDANTGKSVTDGDSKAAALKRLADLAEAVRKEPGKFQKAMEKSRKIYDYPHLKDVFERVMGDPTSDEEGAAALYAERDFMSGLAGDLLTCNKWKVRGATGKEYIRCEEYKRTCQPGDPDCVGPGKIETDEDPMAWARRNPFTAAQKKMFDRGSRTKIDLNRQFEDDVQRKIDIVLKEMAIVGTKDLPDFLDDALADYRQALYDRYITTAEMYGKSDKPRTQLLKDKDKHATEQLRAADRVVFSSMKRMSSEALFPEQKKTQVEEGVALKAYQDVEFTTSGGVKKTGTISTIHDGVVYVIPDGASNAIPVAVINRVILSRAEKEKLVKKQLKDAKAKVEAEADGVAKSSMSPETDLKMFNFLSSEAARYKDSERFAELWGNKTFSKNGLMILDEDRVVLFKAQTKGRRRFTATERATMKRYDMADPAEMWAARQIIQDHTGLNMQDFWRLISPGEEAEPTPKPVKERVEDIKEAKEKREVEAAEKRDILQEKVLRAIGDGRPTVQQIAERAGLSTQIVVEVRGQLLFRGDILTSQDNYQDVIFLKPKGRARIKLEPVKDIRNGILQVIMTLKPETIDQLSKRFKMTKDEIWEIVSSMEDDNAVVVRMQRGRSPLVVSPDYAAKLKDYERAILEQIRINPRGDKGDIMHKLFLDEAFVQQALLDLESDKSIKSPLPISEVGSHEITLTAKGKKQLARGGMDPKAAIKLDVPDTKTETAPAEPEQIWMKEKPFTEDDTDGYNRYTFYPIDDLNAEFEKTVKPELDKVGRLMKEYDVAEIPAEVQTALMWHRRRTYEYLMRKIYSRNAAPGAAIVGPSNYNHTKHRKVMDADEKYWKNLETSARKLEIAIKKTITRGRGGKPAVSVKEREKWQEIALKTKRTAFGKVVLENQIAYNKANPDKAPRSIDLSDPKSTFRSSVRQEGRNIHARLILDAHQRGLEIDPEVLAQYPALTPNLSGIGTMLQAANALYSLAKVVL